GVRFSQLVLEQGIRHQSLYSTPVGMLSIGVYTESIWHEVDETGGRIEIDYTIDFNSDVQSENHLDIILRKKGVVRDVENSD
ncbi:MAG: DUF1934 domain-containing protein, partial [Clostridia bacterium]|nr:DUF1934 domain-containing protein [Clostridia bacterium]